MRNNRNSTDDQSTEFRNIRIYNITTIQIKLVTFVQNILQGFDKSNNQSTDLYILKICRIHVHN